MIALGANASAGNVSEKTRGYSTSKATSGYTFSGGEYITVAITGKGGTSRPTTEVMKQYTVAAGSSGGNSLTYQKDANGTSSSSGFDWLSKSETVSIRAWSDGKTTTASTPATDPHNSLFTIEKTQNTKDANNNVQVKELLYSPAKDYDYEHYSSSLNIPLYHQLARIVITVTRDDTDHDISAITIGNSTNKVPIAGTFSKPTTGNNVGSWAVATIEAQPTHWDVITPKEETANSVYSAVMIPATYAEDLKLINFSVNTRSFAYKLPADVTFQPGKQYNYNITVKNSSITVTSNITDWTDAENGTNFTHGDGLARTKDIKMNPLWYIAEGFMTNSAVGPSATLTMGTGNTGYFYTWTDAMQTFAAQNTTYSDYKTAGKTISGQEGSWHLPVRAELLSIIPGDDRGNNILSFDSDVNDLYSVAGVIFGYNLETKGGITDISYWKKISTNQCRAIRFLGTDYCSAWEYQISGTSPIVLTITSCLIDRVDDTKTAASIAYDEIDWDNLSSRNLAEQRVFYARGYKDIGSSSTADKYIGTVGVFWSATDANNKPGYAASYTVYFSNVSLDVDSYTRQTAGFNVCLFRDN